MKFTKTSEKQLCEYLSKMDANGCVVASDWTSGSGRFTKPKTLPQFVKRYARVSFKGNPPQHNTPERTAYEFFRANPGRMAVLVMDTEAAMRFLFDAAHGREI